MAVCAATTSTSGVLTNALELVDCYTNNFVFDAYAHVFGPGTGFAGVLTTALVLYVAIYGIQIALGNASLTLDQFGPRMLKIGFIIALLSAWPTFQRLVVDVAFGAPARVGNEMLKLLGSGSGDQAGVISGIDRFYDKMMDAAASYMARASWTELDYYIGAAFIWAVTIIAMFFAFGFLLVAKLATALILGVGPLFIGLFLFAGTRGLFEGWLRSLTTFALVPLFLLTSLAMLLAITSGTVDTIHAEAAAGNMTWDNLVLLVVITAGFALLFLQIPHITAGIAGGVSIGGVGAAMAAIGIGSGVAAIAGTKLAAGTTLRGGTLAYAMRNPAARAATLPELSATKRRVVAGLGERARWWTRVSTTPTMRREQRTEKLTQANETSPT